MNTQKNTLRYMLLAFYAAASATLVGCQPGNRDSKLEDVILDSQYAKASCEFKYDQGEVAILRQPNILYGPFSKKYNASNLDSVLSASLQAIVGLAEQTGVQFYHVPAKESDSCLTMSAIPATPIDLYFKFKDVDDGSVLGLYLGKGSKGLPSTKKKAAIVVRKDSNKWVLVHEYMHHLFYEQLLKDDGYEDIRELLKTASKDFEAAAKQVESAKGDLRVAALVNVETKFLLLGNTFINFLREYPLEEMAIEAILRSKHDLGSFNLVIEGQKLNGAAYTISSAETAQKLLDSLKDLSARLEQSLILESYTSTKIQEVLSKAHDIELEMNNIKDSAQAYLDSKNVKMGLDSRQTSPEFLADHQGCAHARASEEATEILLHLSIFK